MSKIIFQIEGGAPVTIEANPGDNLLELARRANVAIDAPCSGNGSCGKCRVKLVSGEVDSRRLRLCFLMDLVRRERMEKSIIWQIHIFRIILHFPCRCSWQQTKSILDLQEEFI